MSSINDSHCKNRIIEFIERGYNVEVYGFSRANQKIPDSLPYTVQLLGELHDERYAERLKKYFTSFKKIGKKYKNRDVTFYLTGLDIAMIFHFLNPRAKYIYEECDLTHTYLGLLKRILEWVDKKIIKKSFLTVSTSEGFVEYHFGERRPSNVILVENRLNPLVEDCKVERNKKFNPESLSIGFVGGPRFDSIYNFIDVFCQNFPSGTFHIYGGPVPENFQNLRKYQNCEIHGFFKNPIDLPTIYNSIDLVVATYDTKFENVKYAEPNKIYESIYFETPIVVSTGTFLANKVKKLGIGFDINAMDDSSVINFINSLSEEVLNEKVSNMKKIDKRDMLNINNHLFSLLHK